MADSTDPGLQQTSLWEYDGEGSVIRQDDGQDVQTFRYARSAGKPKVMYRQSWQTGEKREKVQVFEYGQGYQKPKMAGLAPSSSRVYEDHLDAVSYTHLDVYKRQALLTDH